MPDILTVTLPSSSVILQLRFVAVVDPPVSTADIIPASISAACTVNPDSENARITMGNTSLAVLFEMIACPCVGTRIEHEYRLQSMVAAIVIADMCFMIIILS